MNSAMPISGCGHTGFIFYCPWPARTGHAIHCTDGWAGPRGSLGDIGLGCNRSIRTPSRYWQPDSLHTFGSPNDNGGTCRLYSIEWYHNLEGIRKGGVVALFDAISYVFSGGTEENYENLSQNNQQFSRNFEWRQLRNMNTKGNVFTM